MDKNPWMKVSVVNSAPFIYRFGCGQISVCFQYGKFTNIKQNYTFANVRRISNSCFQKHICHNPKARQDMSPLNQSLGYIGYFELQAFENQQMQGQAFSELSLAA